MIQSGLDAIYHSVLQEQVIELQQELAAKSYLEHHINIAVLRGCVIVTATDRDLPTKRYILVLPPGCSTPAF